MFRGEMVNEYPAILQWNPKSKTARIGMLVRERFIVNVSVKPVDSVDPAVAVAKSLTLNGLDKLIPVAGPPPTPDPTAPESPQD